MAKTLSDKGNGEQKVYREAEAAEHAELWQRSPKFRTAVERRIKGARRNRTSTGKR